MDFSLNEPCNNYLQIIRKNIAINTHLEYLYRDAGNYNWFRVMQKRGFIHEQA